MMVASVIPLRPVRTLLICSLCRRDEGDTQYEGECYGCWTCPPPQRALRTWTDEQLIAHYGTAIEAAIHGIVNGVNQQVATRTTAELLRRGIDPRRLVRPLDGAVAGT